MKHIIWDGSPEAAHKIYQALRHAIAADRRGHSAETLLTSRRDMPEDARWALLHAPNPVALVVETSGSTGVPKYVCLTLAALTASAHASAAYLTPGAAASGLQEPGAHPAGGTGSGRWLFTLPADHIAGLQILFRSALADAPPVFLDQRESFTPESFVAAASELQSTDVSVPLFTSLVPTQLTRLLSADGPVGLRALALLRSFTAILVGGAATPPALLDRAKDLGVTCVTTYGSSETSGGCVYDGTSLPGARMSIVEGRVHLAGPMLLDGYISQLTAQGDVGAHYGFVDPCTVLQDGRWLPTNDAGEIDANGRLHVHGRLDDIIISGGSNVVPQRVEAALAALPGILDVAVIGIPDAQWGQRVVAVAVLDAAAPPVPELLGRARQRVLAEIDAASAPRDLVPIEALPVLASGKVDRREAAAWAARRLA